MFEILIFNNINNTPRQNLNCAIEMARRKGIPISNILTTSQVSEITAIVIDSPSGGTLIVGEDVGIEISRDMFLFLHLKEQYGTQLLPRNDELVAKMLREKGLENLLEIDQDISSINSQFKQQAGSKMEMGLIGSISSLLPNVDSRNNFVTPDNFHYSLAVLTGVADIRIRKSSHPFQGVDRLFEIKYPSTGKINVQKDGFDDSQSIYWDSTTSHNPKIYFICGFSSDLQLRMLEYKDANIHRFLERQNIGDEIFFTTLDEVWPHVFQLLQLIENNAPDLAIWIEY